MNTNFLKQLKSHLPEQSWPWVVAALRQDELVWETLQSNNSFLQSPMDEDQHPENWNPARVAFLILQQTVPPPNAALSLGLRQRAFRAYETITQNPQTMTAEKDPMVQAALLAVALRERFRSTGKWDNLSTELALAPWNIWRTPLACLYGLIEKPIELLRSLLSENTSTELHHLAIHALLSNPLPPEEQYGHLSTLLNDLPVSGQNPILVYLSTLRPELAAKLARQINFPSIKPSNSPIDNLVAYFHRAEIAIFAGNHTLAADSIKTAQDNARWIQANLAAQNAQICDAPLPYLQKAFELAPEVPAYRSRLALAHLEAQNITEANAILEPAEIKDQPDLLYASACLAHLSGDDDRARVLASQAISILETSTSPPLGSHNNSPSLALQLAQFLVTLNLPSAAIRATQIAIRERTNDPERLVLLGQAHTSAGQHAQAAEAYQWAVLLAPQQIGLHRELAKSLEAAGDWALALEERKIMASDPTSPVIDDQYALANCALQNNQAAYAADLCRVILTNNPQDGLAHTLLGEALAAVGDLAAAQVHFTQASELAPNLARPWLALARTQIQSNQPQKALETLRIASQAIPGSAEIHQVLGDYYLSVNATTQALEAFQHAAEINPRNIPIALRLGQTLYLLGHIPQAHQVLQQAYQQEPTNPEVALPYARVLMGQDDPQSALPALKTVIASNPIDPAPFIDFARALLLTHGDAAKATKALLHALELVPNHAEARALLGESLAAENQYEAALQAFQAGLETSLAQNDEWHARLSYGLGGVALHLGKTEIAIAALLESIRIDPQNYRPHCQLAEAYQTAGLIPDAYQAANEALRLAGDDINVMIWYVEKTLELAGTRQSSPNVSIQKHPPQEELRHHALQILSRAAEIAPAQASLYLRIANIQRDAGDFTSAGTNLRRVSSIKLSTPTELQQAAQVLLSLHDAAGAVSCYEKALENQPETVEDKDIKISLLSQLAYAYRQAHNPQAALQANEKAILLSPDESKLFCTKAQLLLELGQPKSAINILEETITRLPEAGLHRCAATILQTEGKLLEALEHAETGANLLKTQGNNEQEKEQVECVVLAADLALALLLPDRARHILDNQKVATKNLNNPIYSTYHVVCAELALDYGEENERANLLSAALKNTDTQSPRLLSLQARLTAQKGDYPTALVIYQSALQKLGETDSVNPGSPKPSEDKNISPSSNSQSVPTTSPATLYPITETALELNLWGIALRLAQKAVQLAPAEPLAHLTLAHVLVHRAEFQYLCHDSDLITHAPGTVALSEGTCRAFDQAIQEALSLWEGISQRTHTPNMPHLLERWQSRGNAVFTPSIETTQSLSKWTEHSTRPEDIAAAIAAERRMTISNDQQEIYRSQQSGAVLTQIALSLSDKNTDEAIKLLQMAILNEPVHNIHNAIRHYLLARLAHLHHLPTASSAIQTAITLLPNEPRWCALAAKISLINGDKSSAISLLENAIHLESRNVDHHLALGQLYLHYAEDSNVTEALQAVKCFERACRLAPEHPDAWLLLARAHRITGNLDQAAAAAEQSSTLAPEMAASHLIQAEIALQSVKPQSAHDHAQTALHLQPDSHQAAMILSRALQALNRPTEALAVIDKAIPASEQSISLSIERIQLLRQSKGPEVALQAAYELAQINPDEPAVLALLAEIQADAGQEDTAIRTAQKAILLGESLSTSQQASMRLLLGQLLRRAGQLDQAVHHLDEVIRMQPEKIDALLELGRTHQDRRQQAQALLMYQRAAHIAPHDPRPYLQAGLALKEGKDYVESESMLRRAADLAPNDPTIRRQLAAVIAINLVHNPHHSRQTQTV